jgi:hypothetical protein
MRMLTVKLAGDSKSMIMAGDELTVADSGDELQKGMAKFVLPLAPLGAWILLDDHWDTSELPDHFTAQGLAENGGELRRCLWVVLQMFRRDRERLRDREGVAEH